MGLLERGDRRGRCRRDRSLACECSWPLNEDCWLGINGLPAGGLTVADYRQAIEAYVADLGADGIYAILDLHWSAPGTVVADRQRAMPDGHSAAFWSSVASTFEADHAVLFDAFNEPYSPAADGYGAYPVSWSCWELGGCTVPDAADGTAPGPANTYTAIGMQSLVDAIRATGATQPILLGGLGYANDLTGWLASEPSDPDRQLAASVHVYDGQSCATVTCWNAQIAPVASTVPVVTGEFDESDCPASPDDPSNFDNTYMSWADAHGVSYLAWGWYVLDPASCSSLYLITDPEGTPAVPNGVAVHDHLVALASTLGGGGTTTTATTQTRSASMSPQPTLAAREATTEITRSLLVLIRAGSIQRTATVLLGRGAAVRFTAPVPGRLTVAWIASQRRGRRTTAVVIASGATSFSHAATASVHVRLTAGGRRLLHSLRARLTVAIRLKFVPARTPPAMVTADGRLSLLKSGDRRSLAHSRP